MTVATVFYYFSRLHRFVVLLGASWLLKVLLYALLGLIRSRMVD